MLNWTKTRAAKKNSLLAAFGLAAASWLGGPSVATEAAAEDLWRPYFEFENRGNEHRYTAQANLFVPVFQNCGTLVFADLRAQVTDQSTSEGNFGVAMRTMLDNDKIFGAYGFYDIKESPFGNTFEQGVVGFELLDEDSGARINGYIPDQQTQLTGAAGAVLFNNNIFVQAGVEAAYWGVDVEYEKRLFLRPGCCAGDNARRLSGSDIEIWASAGVFHFDNHNAGFREITGPRLRTELRLYDIPFLGNDSRLVLSGQYEYDGVRDSVGTGLINVRIPLGKKREGSARRLYGLNRRMVAPIVRDVDVVTNAAPGVLEQAKIARTGQVISQAVVIDANTVTPENVVAAAGNNSVVIADGAAGVIMPGGSLMLNDGQVLMSGGGGLNVVGCDTGVGAVFNAPFTRAMINTGINTAVQAADNSSIIGIDLMTTGNVARGVVLNDDQNVLISSSTITTTGANNSGVNDAFGIESLLGSTLTVFGSTISTTNAGGFADAVAASGTSQNTFNNSVISTAGAGSFGVNITGASVNAFNGSTVNSTAGPGINMAAGSTGATTLTNSTVNTTSGNGINAFGTGATTLTNSTVNTTTGTGVNRGFGSTGATTLTNSTVNTTSGNGINAFGTGATTLTNSHVNTTGNGAIGISGDGDTPYTISLTDSTVTTAGANAHAIQVDEDPRLTVLRGSLTTTGAGASGVVVRDEAAPDNALVLIDNVDVNTAGVGIDLLLDTTIAFTGSTINATIRNNRIRAGVPAQIRATTTAANSVYNVSISGNTLFNGLGQIQFNETAGMINVEQASAAALGAANGIPAGNVIENPMGSVTFGAAAPAMP